MTLFFHIHIYTYIAYIHRTDYMLHFSARVPE